MAAKRSTWGKLNRQRWGIVRHHVHETILDLGCSSGDYIKELRKLGHSAYGLDLLSHDNWRIPNQGYFTQGDICQIPFESECISTVVAFEVLEHITHPEIVLEEIRRVCKKNFILSVPDCDVPKEILRAGMIYNHWLDPTHYQYFNQSEIISLVEKSGFLIKLVKKINPVLPDLPVFGSFYIPLRLAHLLSRITLRFPFRRRFYRTIILVADKE